MNVVLNAEKLNGKGNATFICGDFTQKLGEVLKNKAPACKVAFIATSDVHLKYVERILPAAVSVNSKVISFIMPTPVADTAEYFAAPFNLPNEVRAVLVLDNGLYNLASYFAKVRGIPLIYAPVSACVSGALSRFIYVKNGERYDRVEGTSDITVIVDENLVNGDLAEAYAFNMSRLCTLIDYRVTRAFTGEKTDAAAYFLLLEGVTGTYAIFSERIEDRALCLLFNGLKIALADNSPNFSFINKSSEKVAAMLKENKTAVSPENELFFALKILQAYGKAFKTEEVLSVNPNLLARAEYVAEKLKIEQAVADQELINQSEKLCLSIDKAAPIMKKLIPEVEDLCKNIGAIISAYLALGGEPKTKKTATEIKYCGDTPFGVNAFSLLRELGITDAAF